MSGRVDDVDLYAAVVDGGVLGQDGDAALALEGEGVHDALHHLFVGAEDTALVQHRVDQRGLAVIDVRDDRDVADVLSSDFRALRHAVPGKGVPSPHFPFLREVERRNDNSRPTPAPVGGGNARSQSGDPPRAARRGIHARSGLQSEERTLRSAGVRRVRGDRGSLPGDRSGGRPLLAADRPRARRAPVRAARRGSAPARGGRPRRHGHGRRGRGRRLRRDVRSERRRPAAGGRPGARLGAENGGARCGGLSIRAAARRQRRVRVARARALGWPSAGREGRSAVRGGRAPRGARQHRGLGGRSVALRGGDAAGVGRRRARGAALPLSAADAERDRQPRSGDADAHLRRARLLPAGRSRDPARGRLLRGGAAHRRAGGGAGVGAELPVGDDGPRPGPRSDDPADPRIHRTPAGARPHSGRRAQLRRNQLRHPGDVRHLPLRLRAAERRLRSDPPGAARQLCVRRRGPAGHPHVRHPPGHPLAPARRHDLAGARRSARRGQRPRLELEPAAHRPHGQPEPRARQRPLRGADRGDRERGVHGDQLLVVDRRLAQQVPVRLRVGASDREGAADGGGRRSRTTAASRRRSGAAWRWSATTRRSRCWEPRTAARGSPTR